MVDLMEALDECVADIAFSKLVWTKSTENHDIALIISKKTLNDKFSVNNRNKFISLIVRLVFLNIGVVK